MATTPPSLQEGKTGKPIPAEGKPLGLLECRGALLGSDPENSLWGPYRSPLRVTPVPLPSSASTHACFSRTSHKELTWEVGSDGLSAVLPQSEGRGCP